MTYTHMRRLLSLVVFITLGLASSIIQSKYIGGTGIAATYTKRVAVDAVLDTAVNAVLIGNDPATATISNMIYDGFDELLVAGIEVSDGTLELATFNGTTGYLVLDETNIKADTDGNGTGTALITGFTDPNFVPGAIILDNADPDEYYYVLATARDAGATNNSIPFITRMFADSNATTPGTIDKAFNGGDAGTPDGGSVNITPTTFVGTLNTFTDPLWKINAAVLANDLIYIVGTVSEDEGTSAAGSEYQGFIGVYDPALTTGNPAGWIDQGTTQSVILVDGGASDVELLGLAVSGTSVYVSGRFGNDAIVLKITDNGSGVLSTTNNDSFAAATSPLTNLNFGTTTNIDGYKYTAVTDAAKAYDIAYANNAFATTGDLVVAITNAPVVSASSLQQSITVVALTDAGAIVAGFGSSGITYTFADLPTPFPLEFSENYPNYSFECPLSLQIGDSNAIFVCGTLSAYGMPFVYKLNSSGAEQPFAPNFRYGIDTGNLISAVLDPSSILYPVMGYSWETGLEAIFASTINNTTDQLYLFGTSGNVQRSTSDDAFTLNSASDTAQQIPTGNLDLLTENNYPILRTASNTAGLTVSNLYNSSGVTLSANADGLALVAGTGGLFDTNSLYITIPTQTILAGAFTGDVGTITEIYGSVDINGITIPLSGTGTITVADAAGDDFTTDNGTDITGTLRGAYSGGLVQITFTSATINDTASGNVTGEYANPIITNYYSSGGVTVFANQTGLTVANQSEAIFSTDLTIAIPRQTVASGSFTGDDATVEVFGSVTVSGQEVALSGDGTITVTNAAGSDFSLADFASTLTGRYSGGTVTITVSSNGTNLTNVSSPTTDITTSNVNITVNNNYDPVTGDYVISVSDANISVTGESAYTVTVLNFDVIETANTGDQNLFGTVVVDFGGGAQTIAVAGRLDVTVANDQVTAIVIGGGTIDAPTGSYVIGRFNNDKTIFIKINAHSGGSTIVNTRAEASIVGTCTLDFDNDATAGTSAVVLIDSITGDNAMVPTATTANITMDSVTLTSTTKTFTQKGQHKILVTGSLQFDLDASNEDDNTVTVSGYMPVTVLQDYTVTAEPFKMTGTFTNVGDGDITVTLWVNDITVVNS